MAKVTLDDLSSLANETSAVNKINTNNTTIEQAFENTLSRDGTSPNQMGADFDMNSHRILNLPNPATATEPLRLQDLLDFTGSGVVSTIPSGGTPGQYLGKVSNTNYDTTWKDASSLVSAGTNTTVTGTTPVTVDLVASPSLTGLTLSSLAASSAVATNGSKGLVTIANTGTGNNVLDTSPTLVTPILGTPTSGTLTNCTGLPVSTGISGLAAGVAAFLATPTSANLITAVTNETGTGSLVFATSPTLVTPLLGTPTSGVLTNCTGLPISTGVSGLGTGVATFLATPTSANLSAALTDETGSGSAVFGTSPTITTPRLIGVTNASTPTAGDIGEIISANILIGSAVSLTTTAPTTITSIVLTAGYWLIWAQPAFTGGATTTVTALRASISTTIATENTASPNFTAHHFGGATAFANFNQGFSIAPFLVNISSGTTYYLVARADFGTSTCTGYGAITAQRIR